MSSEWEMQPLGNYVHLISGNTPLTSNPNYWGGSTPWISAKDMGAFWIADSEDHLTAEGVSVASKLVPEGSVLMLTRGMTLHKRVPICRTAKPATFNQDVKAVLPKATVSGRFLPYLLTGNHDRLHAKVDSAGHGTGRLNTDAILSFPVWVPHLTEQEGIAEIGEALDDRITLLRETNTTLEAIAQALFKSWFVDFDPVRAKMEGRAPEGMDEATAALFPDALEESELGWVPKGWRVGELQDLLLLQRGFDLPSDDRVVGAYPIIAASGPSGTHKIAMAKGPGVVTGRSGVLGKVFLELGDYWPLNTTLWVKEFKAATPCYAYEVLRCLDFHSFNAGSAVPTLNRNHIHGLKYLIPSLACVEAYESMVIGFHERARVNRQQAQTLATLRDTLLPRLISGQLRLPEAQALAAEV